MDHTCFVQTLNRSDLDVIGDVHGAFPELLTLLLKAGYIVDPFDPIAADPIALSHPEGRAVVFLGDLTDRGPDSHLVLRLAMGGRAQGSAYNVLGNHDWKLARKLAGRNVTVAHGLDFTLQQMAPLGAEFEAEVLRYFWNTPHQINAALPANHPLFGDGRATLVHAAAQAYRQDQSDQKSFERSIYGYPENNTDAHGGLLRKDWATAYEGDRLVVHGHVVSRAPRLVGRVLNIDTGAVFGGALTLLRLDDFVCLSVAAVKNWAGIKKVFLDPVDPWPETAAPLETSLV